MTVNVWFVYHDMVRVSNQCENNKRTVLEATPSGNQRYSLTNPFMNQMQITRSITCSLSLTIQNMIRLYDIRFVGNYSSISLVVNVPGHLVGFFGGFFYLMRVASLYVSQKGSLVLLFLRVLRFPSPENWFHHHHFTAWM